MPSTPLRPIPMHSSRRGMMRGGTPLSRIDFSRALSGPGQGAAFPPLPPGGGIPPTSYDRLLRSLIGHATMGFSIPSYLEAKAMGYDAWLEWQLDYENIDDSAVDQALGNYPTLTMTNPDLYTQYEFDPNAVIFELQEALLLRAIYSRKQLYERMVEFWNDHFNINQLDFFCMWFKTRDDFRVARKHALGNFPAMLKTSPKSAAMIWYLDNWINIVGQTQENYGRELLELHTLGVTGPYTETDVKEVARCFTGWTFTGVFDNAPPGVFTYKDALHDQGQKVVLGNVIPAGGGQSDAETVLDILAMHPSTANHISTKMAKFLLGYNPPADLIQRLVSIYLSTGGEIKPMVREILSKATLAHTPVLEKRKFKRPFQYLTSIMRATQASSNNLLELTTQLQAMGQVPFFWGPPNGYPDTAEQWSHNLQPRWAFASDFFSYDLLYNKPDLQTLKDLMAMAPPGLSTAAQIDFVMTGGDTDDAYVAEVQAFIDSQSSNPNVVLREAFTLIAQGPSFQYYA